MARIRLVVLISGNGSNLQAVIDAIESRQLDADIVSVISNRKSAYGLTRAENAKIQTTYVPLGPYRRHDCTRDAYDSDLADLVKSFDPDLVVLAGWMHILGPSFINRFSRKLINLHPALPGYFPGINSIERAWSESKINKLSKTGVMVHYVVDEIDAGEPIAIEEIIIDPDETLEELKIKIHNVEHRLLVSAINKIINEELT